VRRLVACWLLLAAPAAAECVLGGTVLDGLTRKPLAGAKVFARWKGETWHPAVLHVTDAAGAFCFEQLPPGDYDLVMEHAGYLVSVKGGAPGESGGAVFAVGAQTRIPALQTALLPFASVSGTVVDSKGQPLPGFDVELLRKRWSRGWQTEAVDGGDTDEHGGFRFTKEAPGTYYLQVDVRRSSRQFGIYLDEKGHPWKPAEVRTFYPGSLTLQGATPIVLEAGQEVANLTIAMVAATPRRISGHIAVMWPPHTQPIVSFISDGQGLGFVRQVQVEPDGSFSADDLYPAQYGVHLSTSKGELWKSVDVTLGDADGVTLEPFPARVPLRVVLDANGRTAPQTTEAVNLANGNQAYGQKDSTGAHLFNLEPGRYRLIAISKDLYIQNLVLDGRARPDATIEVRGETQIEAHAVLSGAMAHVTAQIERPAGAEDSPAVTLVWEDVENSIVQVEGDSKVVPQNGTLELKPLAPGKYRLFAIEGFDDRPWGCPELAAALEAKSVELDLKPGETRKVAAPVIAFSEWVAALRKVGM